VPYLDAESLSSSCAMFNNRYAALTRLPAAIYLQKSVSVVSVRMTSLFVARDTEATAHSGYFV